MTARPSGSWLVELTPLSPSERVVLELAAAGKTASESAVWRGRGLETVKQQRRSVLWKLGARNMTHAVAIAFRHGLLT